MDIQGRHVADFDSCQNPGDFYFTPPGESGGRRLSFRCPCGCGDLCGIKVRTDGSQQGDAWGWNQNEERPTTTPSIRIGNAGGSDHWHGYLTDGVFKPC